MWTKCETEANYSTAMIFQTTIRRISGPLLSIRRSVSRSVRSSLARNARNTPTGRAGKLVKRSRPLLGNRFRFEKNAPPPKLIVSNCDGINEGKFNKYFYHKLFSILDVPSARVGFASQPFWIQKTAIEISNKQKL